MIPLLLFISLSFGAFPDHLALGEAEAPLTCDRENFHETTFDTVWVDLDRTPLRLFWKDEGGDRYQNFLQLKNRLVRAALG